MTTVGGHQNSLENFGSSEVKMLSPVDKIQEADWPKWEARSANKIIISYLLERAPEFRTLAELREKGWKNPKGDTFFQNQRQTADNCDDRTAKIFYDLMKRIAHEIHGATNALRLQTTDDSEPPRILDMCMAPGGFLHAALTLNAGARATAFSLPVWQGGHKVLLPRSWNVRPEYLDITMLAADMGVEDIPPDHEDAENFLPRKLAQGQAFDLVLCDGQVLRTHTRASYRETVEARRLTSTQLALGLEHTQPGGTMVVLLHKAEAWDTVNLIYTFRKFSSVRLFKPKSGHAKRSSFYMIATNVQSLHPEAARAVVRLKETWRVATFGEKDEYAKAVREADQSVEEILEEFGAEFIDLAREVWNVQAKALSRAPFIKGQ